jgi:hypothetical protein
MKYARVVVERNIKNVVVTEFVTQKIYSFGNKLCCNIYLDNQLDL